MLDAALKNGTALSQSVFEVFARRLPGGRRYAVTAGTGRLLEEITGFTFGDQELAYLRSNRIVSEKTLEWLANYRFTGNITGYPEGEVFFPGSPILTFEGNFAECVLLETLALSIMNFDSAIATAASRMVTAAAGKPLAEMGSRRTHEVAATSAARAAYLAGFTQTSNLAAGALYGIPTMGTAAHSFTLLHDSEEQAFRAQLDALGPDTALLIDTYDIDAGVRAAVKAAGTGLGGVRIDSGDMPGAVNYVRTLLDDLGAKNTKITVTNDLDEYTLAALAKSSANAFGVGTSLVTGSGNPTMGLVYKLVARKNSSNEWVQVAKRSEGKVSRGGKKSAERAFQNGTAIAENITVGPEPRVPPGIRERRITQQLMLEGVPAKAHLGTQGLATARRRHRASVSELPADARRLTRGDPCIPTVYR